MKRFLAIILAIGLSCTSFFYNETLAYDVPSLVRVGLEAKYKDVSRISINNTMIDLGYESGGQFNKNAYIESGSKFEVMPTDGYFVKAGGDFFDFAAAQTQAQGYISFGYASSVAFTEQGFAAYIGTFATKQEADNIAAMLSGQVIEGNPKRLTLNSNGVIVAVFEKSGIQMRDATGAPMSLGERKYREAIEFVRNGGSVSAINVLNMDNYLYSVVPSEMPSTWHLEALKAQTVAARSYALTRIAAHKSSGYNFCDGVHCQNYLGAGNEAASTNEAVLATSGIVATSSNEPINAVYFSSSGGQTENSENVWTNVIPYLRGVTDTYEISGKQWVRSFTLQEISALAPELGGVTDVTIGSVSPTGRVMELIINGKKSSKTLKKEEIRTFFSGSKGSILESRNFSLPNGTATSADTKVAVLGSSGVVELPVKTLTAISSNGTAQLGVFTAVGLNTLLSYQPTQIIVSGGSSTGDTVVFSGRGWGHGVGMSQYGAKDMAMAGLTFTQILQHYYTGIEVK